MGVKEFSKFSLNGGVIAPFSVMIAVFGSSGSSIVVSPGNIIWPITKKLKILSIPQIFSRRMGLQGGEVVFVPNKR